jgi:hypothetical protein
LDWMNNYTRKRREGVRKKACYWPDCRQ